MIRIQDISFAYGKNEVLKGISLDVALGECVGVLGNNGAGKSTLITCLNKIRTPRTGKIYISGRDVGAMSKNETAQHIAYVPQKNEVSRTTVFDGVLLGRKPYIQWGVSPADMTACEEILEKMDLTRFKLRYMDELSGGEVQKVMLARAFVQEPKLLLLDEPTSNLDPKNQFEVMGLVKAMARERNIAVLIVIHDLSLALRCCDKFLFLKDGRVYRYGDASVVTEETIREVYEIPSKIIEVDGKKIAIVG